MDPPSARFLPGSLPRRLVARLLRALLIAPALGAALASAYMVIVFPPFHLIDEGGHLHAVAALAAGRLPHVGEPLEREIMALATRMPADAAALPTPPRYFLLHPPAYYMLAAPWFALARGDWEVSLVLVRLFAGLALVATALAVPWILVRAGARGGADRLDVYAGALIASLPLAAPGVLFSSNFATNHLLDVVFGVLLGVSCARVLSFEDEVGDADDARARRWLFVAALLAGLLAASRLSNLWALPIPLALVFARGRVDRARLRVVGAGLLPGCLLLALWCADNLRATGEIVPTHLADQVVTAEIGPEAAALPPLRLPGLPRLLAAELLLGQGKPARLSDGVAADAIALAFGAWLVAEIATALARRRSAGARRSSTLRAALLAAYGFAASVAFLVVTVAMSTVPRLVGRYLLTGVCFAVALAGAANALRSRESGSRPEGAAIAPAARALVALVLAALVLAAWFPTQWLTPPHWGVPDVDSTPSLLERLFGPPDVKPTRRRDGGKTRTASGGVVDTPHLSQRSQPSGRGREQSSVTPAEVARTDGRNQLDRHLHPALPSRSHAHRQGLGPEAARG